MINKEIIRKTFVVTATKAAMLVIIAGSYLMPGNDASWLPLFVTGAMGWTWAVLKSNVKGF